MKKSFKEMAGDIISWTIIVFLSSIILWMCLCMVNVTCCNQVEDYLMHPEKYKVSKVVYNDSIVDYDVEYVNR